MSPGNEVAILLNTGYVIFMVILYEVDRHTKIRGCAHFCFAAITRP